MGHVWGTNGWRCVRAVVSYTELEMSSEHAEPVNQGDHLELPVEELVRRARPLPPHEEMIIDDLTPEEGTAFLAALEE